jgi:predicted DNA-binding transcriptional regulator AlpA
MEREAYTIEEFCRSHGFSRAHYFNMQKDGFGPRIMRLGSRVLISKEAAADWRRGREVSVA